MADFLGRLVGIGLCLSISVIAWTNFSQALIRAGALAMVVLTLWGWGLLDWVPRWFRRAFAPRAPRKPAFVAKTYSQKSRQVGSERDCGLALLRGSEAERKDGLVR